LQCLLQREICGNLNPDPDDPLPVSTSNQKQTMPNIFTDPGWALLSTSILSTSNCGNPALRLFGFGPVASDGYGIGYIIKEDGISMLANSLFEIRSSIAESFLCSCASSKHLQTRRFLDTLQGYLLDIQRLLVSIHLEANARPAPFVDHAGILRDSKTGRPINSHAHEVPGQDEDGDDDLMRKS
jgi:carnitine O-acetyltransferase